MLEFDSKTTRILEDAYQGSDFTRRRRASFDALDPRTGETILDLGCGPGLLTLEFARAVGPDGNVIGVDPSDDMLQSARALCGERQNIDLVKGSADTIPLPDATVDKAASVQVFEYISDLAQPLRELHRVLRQGGRLVIADIHFNSLIWYSAYPERMSAMLAAWDAHLADRAVPEHLPIDLAANGFRLERVVPVAFCDTQMRPNGLAKMTWHLMQAHAVQNSPMSPQEVRDWASEQTELARTGGFFFAITQYVCVATRQ